MSIHTNFSQNKPEHTLSHPNCHSEQNLGFGIVEVSGGDARYTNQLSVDPAERAGKYMTPPHSTSRISVQQGSVDKARIHEHRGRRRPGFPYDRRSDLKGVG